MPKLPNRYPEPGTWVDEREPGMPVLEEAKRATGSLSVRDVRDQVAYEGLGYCIYDLVPAGRIQDKRLRRLWSEARNAMLRIVNYLENPRTVPRKVEVGEDIGGEE